MPTENTNHTSTDVNRHKPDVCSVSQTCLTCETNSRVKGAGATRVTCASSLTLDRVDIKFTRQKNHKGLVEKEQISFKKETWVFAQPPGMKKQHFLPADAVHWKSFSGSSAQHPWKVLLDLHLLDMLLFIPTPFAPQSKVLLFRWIFMSPTPQSPQQEWCNSLWGGDDISVDRYPPF